MEIIKFERPDGRKLNFEIIKVLPQTKHRQVTANRHRHEFHSIFFILKGRAVQEVDFEKYEMKKNQLVFIPKGAIHCEMESNKLESYILLFKDDFLAKPMMEMIDGFVKHAIYQRKLVLNLSPIQSHEFLRLAEVIEQEQNQKEHQNFIFILQNLLLVWINKMESIAQKSSLPNNFINNQLIFQKFVALLEKYYIHHKNVSFYCQNLNCTAKRLSQVLMEITGKSTNDIILETVLLEAKRKLCYTISSVKEIAFELGYGNQFYFSRLFKIKEGISPEEFRKRFAL